MQSTWICRVCGEMPLRGVNRGVVANGRGGYFSGSAMERVGEQVVKQCVFRRGQIESS